MWVEGTETTGMGLPFLERDDALVRVFMGAEMLIGPTYHQASGAPPARPARPRAVRRGLAAAAALLCALVLPALGPAPGARAATPSSTLLIEGAGEGHGVGMSQDGAGGLARHGWSYQQILAHYYTGTALGLASSTAKVRVLVGGRVLTLPLERYVRGVVAAEMPSSFPLAALEAQAIASRTYALTSHAGGSRFDVYSDTRSQVYLGAAAETSRTNSAVAATAGQVVTYQGRPVTTYFFASSGGMTENIEDSFLGSEPQPWLKGVLDPYEGTASRWSLSMSFHAAGVRLRGLYRGRFHGIEVLHRGASPRITGALVLGTAGNGRVSGPELASILGLGSTWAYFSARTGTVVHREPDLSGQRPWVLAAGSPAPPPPAAPAAPSGTGAAAAPATGASVSLSGGAEAR